MSIEIRRSDVPGLPPGWKREEVMRKSGLSAGRTDVYYFSPDGVKIRSKPQLSRALGDKSIDLGSFDFRSGRILQSALRKSKQLMRGSAYDYSRGKTTKNAKVIHQDLVKAKTKDMGMRHDANLVLPIRQTASIFKQPVTVIRNFPYSKTRTDLKHGPQDQPRQLFWEKRLQSLYACDIKGERFKALELPHTIQGAGPSMTTENLLQSIAAALHLSNQPITGQSESRSALGKNPGIYVNSEQPLIQAVVVTDQDIRRQEMRVKEAQKGLEAALQALRA